MAFNVPMKQLLLLMCHEEKKFGGTFFIVGCDRGVVATIVSFLFYSKKQEDVES